MQAYLIYSFRDVQDFLVWTRPRPHFLTIAKPGSINNAVDGSGKGWLG